MQNWEASLGKICVCGCVNVTLTSFAVLLRLYLGLEGHASQGKLCAAVLQLAAVLRNSSGQDVGSSSFAVNWLIIICFSLISSTCLFSVNCSPSKLLWIILLEYFLLTALVQMRSTIDDMLSEHAHLGGVCFGCWKKINYCLFFFFLQQVFIRPFRIILIQQL